MNKYYIEQRLRTLIENAVFPISNSEEPFFEIDGIKFKQWDFSNEHGWRGHSWLLSYITSAKSGAEAYREFHEKISKIIPRISLVGQSYTSIYAQSFIISCKSNNITYFRHVKKEDPVGLMFIENEFKALSILMKDNKIPQDFYLFWNDAINTTGYASKMLVMSTAILAIAKKSNGKIDHDLIAEILGEDLREKIFGQKVGLRHRLSHG